MITEPIDDAHLLEILAFAGPDDCIDVADIDQADLIAFAQCTLAAPRRAGIEAHLDRCEYCQLLLVEYGGQVHTKVAVQPTPKHSPWGFMVGAAAAVLLVATLALFDVARPAPYEFADVRGVVAKTMNADAVANDRWRVAKSSSVRIVVRPQTAEPVAAGATAGVFVETSQGVFRRAEATVNKVQDGSSTSFTLEVAGAELLLGRGTGDRVAIVIAESPEALKARDGRTSFGAGQHGVIDVLYRRIEAVY